MVARHALVVDDTDFRHDHFRNIFEGSDYILHHANTVQEAITIIRTLRFSEIRVRGFRPDGSRIIEEPDPIDLEVIFLDHDQDQPGGGPDFIVLVKHILDHPHLFRKKPLFFIHSGNDEGADNMRKALEAGGFQVVRERFSSPEFPDPGC